VAQYAPPVAAQFADLKRTPENCCSGSITSLGHKMRSGRTLWDELVIHYTHGVQAVGDMRHTWAGLSDQVDAERYAQ